MEYPLEPFKIKVIEPLYLTSYEDRARILREAGYNLFNLRSSQITIDLLTDSGTGSMSQNQWSALLLGDESYAGSESFTRFEESVKVFTGKKIIIPVHQGRAAEKILAHILVEEGDYVLSNSFFDTTRANFEFRKANAFDFPSKESEDIYSYHPFKGNTDLEAMERTIKALPREKIKLITITLTNNTCGGQPVSLENIRATKDLAERYGITVHIDACRVAENALFIKDREDALRDMEIAEIVRESLVCGDIVTMSAKKDGLANIGGFIATDDINVAEKCKELLILWEGFPTYGGLAGRDLDAISVGLKEVLNEDFLRYRIGQVEYLGEKLKEIGIPVIWPPGGHAIYVNAQDFLPRIPREQFPAQALAVALYIEGGIRTAEIGSLMFGDKKVLKQELVRLAIPRRVYTRSHLDYVVSIFKKLSEKREDIKGLKLLNNPPFLRHFLAELSPV